MKRFIIPTLLITFLIFGGIFWWNQNNKPVSTNESLQSFIIPKGYSASQIGNKLEDQNLINSALAFKFYAQVTSKSKKIQAGEYLLSPSFSLFKVVNQLTSGPVEEWVTIPEGLRREEVVEKYISVLKRNEADAEVFRQDFLAITVNKEGFLFPDTYLFPKDITPKQIITAMVNQFRTTFRDEWEIQAKTLGFTMHEIITLASIIEKETGVASERPVIASVFHNRLKKNMRLESDPTVIYGIKDFNGNITKKDLQRLTPYNTYMVSGLPPGPIANPGAESIKAALFPAKTNYLYFVAKFNKTHQFSSTLTDHNRAVRKYQLKR
ncbi:MAG: endolytic transglycosylase MltG [Candidatus Marinimicrobia bacterium]|nr:endolytic transglycosylase MltG [Candidatus Neomarinimicrobiota bacterium]